MVKVLITRTDHVTAARRCRPPDRRHWGNARSPRGAQCAAFNPSYRRYRWGPSRVRSYN